MANQDIGLLEKQVREAAAFLQPLRAEVGRVLVGQERLVDGLLMGMLTGGHVLVEGVPGLAKTLAIRTLAQALGGAFSRLQFTPDLLPADLIGTTIYNPQDHSFSVKLGPVFANIVLADEINRAPAKVQSALLEAMQERQVTISGKTHKLPSPFLVMATQNPLEQEGTYPLPEAQIDRFMFKVVITYPERQDERTIIERMAHPMAETNVSQVATLEQVMEGRRWVDQVYMDPKVTEYILDIVFATRPQGQAQLSDRQKDAKVANIVSLVEYGASPRASLALVLAAKARAFIQSRAYVVPQDVKDVALDVLRHRVVPTYEAEAENLNSDDLVKRFLDELRTP